MEERTDDSKLIPEIPEWNGINYSIGFLFMTDICSRSCFINSNTFFRACTSFLW